MLKSVDDVVDVTGTVLSFMAWNSIPPCKICLYCLIYDIGRFGRNDVTYFSLILLHVTNVHSQRLRSFTKQRQYHSAKSLLM